MDAIRYLAESAGMMEPELSELSGDAAATDQKKQILNKDDIERAELEELKERRKLLLQMMEEEQKQVEPENHLVARELLYDTMESSNSVEEQHAARMAELAAIQEQQLVQQWHHEEQARLARIAEEEDERELLQQEAKKLHSTSESLLAAEPLSPIILHTPEVKKSSASSVSDESFLSTPTPTKKSSIFKRGESATLLSAEQKKLYLFAPQKQRSTLLDPELAKAVDSVANYGGL